MWKRDHQYHKLLPNAQKSTTACLTELCLDSFPPKLMSKPSLLVWQCWERGLQRSVWAMKMQAPGIYPTYPKSRDLGLLSCLFLPSTWISSFCHIPAAWAHPQKPEANPTILDSFIYYLCVCVFSGVHCQPHHFVSSVVGIKMAKVHARVALLC